MTSRVRPLAALILLLAAMTVSAPATADPPAESPPQGCLPGMEEPLDARQLRSLYSQPSDCWPKPWLHESITDWQELAPLPATRFPEENPHSEAKVELGQLLFFDPLLSASGQIACASCHDPALGWADGRPVAIGHDRQHGRRNTPTLLNAAHLDLLFWDGRAPSLEIQAIMSMTNPIEMNADLGKVIKDLGAIEGYRTLFRNAWGSETVTEARIAASLATFVRTLSSRPSDFDRFIQGETRRMTDRQLQGMHLFRTRAGCMNCHHGPLLSDGRFHNIGFHFYGRPLEDRGRYLLTGKAEDVGGFRTPGLRDVMYTSPWLHNGWASTLRSLLVFYNAGGARPKPQPGVDDPLFPETSALLEPLNLTDDEILLLEAFMESLSTQPIRISQPKFPR